MLSAKPAYDFVAGLCGGGKGQKGGTQKAAHVRTLSLGLRRPQARMTPVAVVPGYLPKVRSLVAGPVGLILPGTMDLPPA